jgi:hypothetical protein
MPRDPKLARQRGRIGAFALHARYDARETTARARAHFLEGFERLVDPDGALPISERKRRARHARREYFARLAYKSAIVRRSSKEQSDDR